jgi:guanylate kinase
VSRRKTSNNRILFVVSAPSGAGKTTLVAKLLRKDRALQKTVSHTTRSPRRGEKNGRDYFFVTRKRFEEMKRRGDFVEWAKAYGVLYGTSRKTIENALGRGKDVVLVIESHGGRAIHRLYPDSVRILVLPPDVATLRKRLRGRRGEDGTSLSTRIRAAQNEVRSLAEYDYLVVNDRLERGVEDLRAIIEAERHRMGRCEGVLRKFLK